MLDLVDYKLLSESVTDVSLLVCKPGSSLKSLEKLKFLESGYVVSNGFDDFFIGDALQYNWIAGMDNRNWWWQVQSLSYLSDFVDSYEHDDFSTSYFDLVLNLFLSWNSNARNNEASTLAWHDHASAFRLRNIVKWFVFCDSKKLFSELSLDIKNIIPNIITEHVIWLLNDENYSVFTNHGFDQALILYRVSLALECYANDLDGVLSISKKRLIEEIDFAFTDEGVHKENSPGYQQFMISRLVEVSNLSVFGELDVSGYCDKIIIKAKSFLNALTQPDGNLPIIGDTQSIKSKYVATMCSSYSTFDYTQSGYYIQKNKDIFDNDLFLLIKNSHHSNYHRHDDDLMVYIYSNDEIILGDAGLLSHQEGEFERQLVRSHWAHSVPFISKSSVARNFSDKPKQNDMNITPERGVVAKSSAFGCEIERVVDLSSVASGNFIVEDTVLTSGEENISINWYFPTIPIYRFDSGYFRQFVFNNNILTIGLGCDVASEESYCGLSTEVSKSAINSKVFNQSADAMRMSVNAKDTKLRWAANVQPVKNQQSFSRIKLGGSVKSIDLIDDDGIIVKNDTDKALYFSLYEEKVSMNNIDMERQGFFVCFGLSLEIEFKTLGDAGEDVIFIIGFNSLGERCNTYRLKGNSVNKLEFPEEIAKYVIFIRVLPAKLILFNDVSWKWTE